MEFWIWDDTFRIFELLCLLIGYAMATIGFIMHR